ncbi:MAG: InlB B-repeat-containing protein, partial [Firmicutes bacterium]|nr:InlB B-repeat-containing protein [Bacillota bacterium]
ADTTKYSVKQINDYCNENPPSGADKEVVLYAAVYDVVYVTYHDQAGAVIYAEYKKLANGTASADIVLPYSPFKDNQNFAGWVTKDYVDRYGSVDGSMPTYKAGAEEAAWEVGTVKPITASVDLYPYLEEGFWLIFDNNIEGNNTAFGYNDTVSATYTPSTFVAQGKPVKEKKPADPTRPGYSFVAWYTDKAMTNAYDWGSEQNPVYLTAETTLYAKWDMDDTAEYKVVVWLQSVTDNMNATDANKTYDYYFSTTLTGSTGANVLSLSDVTYFQSSHTNPNDSGATNSLYINTKPDETGEWTSTYGFHYRRTKANFDTIKSNGSTVVEVYWDRDVVTYRFYSSSYREYTDLMAQGLYDAPYTGWNTNYMWNLTNNGDVPSSSNTSDDYISISTKFVFYPSGNDTPSVLRQDKTVYFYASSLGDSPATLSHYTQELNAQGTPYYPTTAEKTAYMNYYNRHSFREFPGHVSDCYRIKLPSSSGTYIYANSSGQLVNGSFTAPFSYRLVTAYTGSGTSLSDYTWSGDWITPSSGWTEWIPHGTSLVIRDANNYVVFSPAYLGTMYGYHAPGMAIDFRYKLVEANVTYMYGAFVDKDGNKIATQYSGTIHTSDNYYYGQSIADAGNYTPSVPGYVFVGWYSSPECTADSAYSFTGKKMPEGGVTVYAKFQQMRFRVICDPTDGGTVTDVSFPGAQATMFRLDYGDKIDGEALSSAMSPGKILLGWYTDKDCTDPFSFTTPITDEIVGMDMTYRTASNKSGTDPWNNNLAYTDGDAVVGK